MTVGVMIDQTFNFSLPRKHALSPNHLLGEQAPQALEAAVASIQRLAELTGLPWMCVERATGAILAKTHEELIPFIPSELRKQLPALSSVQVLELPTGLLSYALPLPETVDGLEVVATGFVLGHPECRPHDLVLAAAECNWSQDRFEDWLCRQPFLHPNILRTVLTTASKTLHQDAEQAELHNEVEVLSQQIDHTYEEISLLHALMQNLQISRGPRELAELCLTRIQSLIQSQANVVWIQEKDGTPHFLVEGEIPFDEIGMARLISHFEGLGWSRPLVKNHIDGTLLGADFPGLQSLVIVPIGEHSHRFGWILSCNLSGNREFGTVEASLLNSIATILGTHIRNIDLYQQHEELLLSFVRSLVSTLDAKDPYTRGHSERVALIARRIGETLHLSEDELRDLYLAGLLHDIGKIGVDDRILRKPGKLTDEEFKAIQQHPMIGYSILQGLKNLQKILAGVRNHHESYNGKGYPDGLAGDEIPLMARILAVADSYDAMGSDRPYRKGMDIALIEDIFRRGAGDQWDTQIIDAYFSVRDDIRRICENYSPHHGNLL